jgi:hypothetical protein
MRKFAFLISTLLIFSCQSDDEQVHTNDPDPNENEPITLVKKLTNTADNGNGDNETYVLEFDYNSDKKLTKIRINNYYTELIYNDPTRIEYKNVNENGESNSFGNYYLNTEGNITHCIANDSGYIYRIDFSYSNDGKLTQTMTCNGTEPCINSPVSTQYFYSGDNIIKMVMNTNFGGNPSSYTYHYSFDNKFNPFYNLDYPTKIIINDMFGNTLSQNNVIQEIKYSGEVINYSNFYNTDNYLTNSIGTFEATNSFYVKNEYEYIQL